MRRKVMSYQEVAEKFPVGTLVTFRAATSWTLRHPWRASTSLLTGTVMDVQGMDGFGFPCVVVEVDSGVPPYQVFPHREFTYGGARS